jgi:hypothetical protein
MLTSLEHNTDQSSAGRWGHVSVIMERKKVMKDEDHTKEMGFLLNSILPCPQAFYNLPHTVYLMYCNYLNI